MDLDDFYKEFPSQLDCLLYLELIRWNGNPACPKCGSTKHSPLKDKLAHHCNFCNRTFTPTTNTLFHKSKVDLQKWFYAILLTLQPNDKTTARALSQKLGVTKDTAWAIQSKIKNALITSPKLLHELDKNLNNRIYGK